MNPAGAALFMQLPLLPATILPRGLEVVSVLLGTVGVFSYLYATLAWLKGEGPRKISDAATLGAVYGFMIGLGFAIYAIYSLYIA